MSVRYTSASLGNFVFLCIGGYLFSVAYGSTFLIPLIVDQRGGNEIFAGAIISIAAISALLSVVFSGHIADRLGTTASVALSGIFLAASMFGFFISKDIGNDLIVYGIIIGVGWGMFYTLGPILVAAIIEPERRIKFFALLSGSMMSGIGSGPLIGRFMEIINFPSENVFLIAGMFSLVGSAIFLYLDFIFKKNNSIVPRANSISVAATRKVLSSNAAFPILMVGLGACVFGGLSSFQTKYAEMFGFDYSIFFIGFMVAAIGSRLFLAGYVVKRNSYLTAFFLTLMVTVSLILFIVIKENVYYYFISSVILGVGYGLTYSIINGLAANEAPGEFMPQSLLLFSLSYLICVFGFPIIAGKIIYEANIIVMLYATLGIAIANNLIAIFRIWQKHDEIFLATEGE